MAAIATIFTLTVPISASASYFSNSSRCVLTDDGNVSLRGSVAANADGSWAYFGPVRWIYRMRDLDASTSWTRLHVGCRESVTVNPDGTWVATFSSYPRPTAGFAYRLTAKLTDYSFGLTGYHDNKENPSCRTRALQSVLRADSPPP